MSIENIINAYWLSCAALIAILIAAALWGKGTPPDDPWNDPGNWGA